MKIKENGKRVKIIMENESAMEHEIIAYQGKEDRSKTFASVNIHLIKNYAM